MGNRLSRFDVTTKHGPELGAATGFRLSGSRTATTKSLGFVGGHRTVVRGVGWHDGPDPKRFDHRGMGRKTKAAWVSAGRRFSGLGAVWLLFPPTASWAVTVTENGHKKKLDGAGKPSTSRARRGGGADDRRRRKIRPVWISEI